MSHSHNPASKISISRKLPDVFKETGNPTLSLTTVGAAERGNERMMEEITRPLLDSAITPAMIDRNKEFIVKQVKQIIREQSASLGEDVQNTAETAKLADDPKLR